MDDIPQEVVVVSTSRRPGCFACLIKGGLLIVAILILFVFSAGVILDRVGIPILAGGRLENVPGAMKDSLDYQMGNKGPLPEDVVLTTAIEEFATARGFTKFFDRYVPVDTCIAAAETAGVDRAQLCALLELIGETWLSESENESLVSAYGTALLLKLLGYSSSQIEYQKYDAEGEPCLEDDVCLEPVTYECENATCEAYIEFFSEDWQSLFAFEARAQEWSVVNEASILPPPGDFSSYLVKVPKYHLLRNLNYGLPVDVHGVVIIGTDPGIPPGNLPPIPDGVFVHPVPGGSVSGYRFGPGHRGVDYSGGDGYAHAAQNCTITVSQGGLNQGYGNVVVCQGHLTDGTVVCTLYGHGLEIIRNVGDVLAAGEIIFHIGSTGNSTGPHVHFEIRVGGSGPWCSGANYVDPTSVLPPQ